MKRRAFLGSSLIAGAAGMTTISCDKESLPWERGTEKVVTETDIIAESSFDNLREDFRHNLFDLYLPYWQNGAYDAENGGFMCLLYDDGSVAVEEKSLIDQARALWVYSYLYNNLGEETEHLEIASKTREFMVGNMRAQNGAWFEKVARDGSLIEDVSGNVYGWLTVAEGLSEYYRATESEEDLSIIYETVWAAMRQYDGLSYAGVTNNGGLSMDIGMSGLRKLDHSVQLIQLLSQFLDHTKNRKFEELLGENILHITEDFFNPKLGVMNEYLNHDYSRVAGFDDYMNMESALDAAVTLMFEAVRSEDTMLFDDMKGMIRRFLEIGWDFVFEGFGSGHFYVFDGIDRTRDRLYSVKSMKSHCTLLAALLQIFEYTGEEWAKEWYERVRGYSIEKFDTKYGIWSNAVDRYGRVIQPAGSLDRKKDIYYQPRYFMSNLLTLARLVEKQEELLAEEPI